MENFENLSAFDFVTELPSELLNLSPLYQRFSPIHSPDATDTSFIELQTVQPIILPTSSNNIEPNFEEKVSCEHLNQPFQSIDPNTEHFRPKRAAALAANIWISNLKRKDDYDSSDKENENYIKSQLKVIFLLIVYFIVYFFFQDKFRKKKKKHNEKKKLSNFRRNTRK